MPRHLLRPTPKHLCKTMANMAAVVKVKTVADKLANVEAKAPADTLANTLVQR